MQYVTDTHPFLWYLSDDRRLGKHAKIVFDAAEHGEAAILIPTISLAESQYIAEKKKFSPPFLKVIQKIDDAKNFIPMPLDMAVIKEISLLRKLPDIHDRIIVASALLLGVPLITKDKNIKKSGYINVIW